MTVPLFHIDAPAPREGLSPGRRRTVRQSDALAAGMHPLSLPLRTTVRLHPQAAPVDDRRAPGRRCGNCRHRRVLGWQARSYPKCFVGGREGPLVAHSEATDCRAWWPGCERHEYTPGERPIETVHAIGGLL